MKVAEMLKKFLISRSGVHEVVIRTYDYETKTSEINYLTRFEVEHFHELQWTLAKARLESFELHEGAADGRPVLFINASINNKGVH